MRALVAISQQLTRFTAPIMFLTAVVAIAMPESFAWVKGNVQLFLLGVIMLGMGLTLSKEDYRILAQRPLDIFIGTLAQYTIMPLVAIAIGKGLGLSDGLTLGLVLVGSCPGGVSSNIMSFLAKGDVAFSVGMTTVSTLLAPVVTPLWIMYLMGETIAVDGWGMFKVMLTITLLPIIAGSLVNIFWHNKAWFDDVKNTMSGVAVLAFALAFGGVAAIHGARLLESGLVMLLAIAAHNSAGYLLGYMAGVVCGMSRAKKRALTIEVGVQNTALAIGLGTKFFPSTPEAALAAAVAAMWHSFSGITLANIFARKS